MRIGSSSGPTGDRPAREPRTSPSPTGSLAGGPEARDGLRLSVSRDFTTMGLPTWGDDLDAIELPTAREKIGGLPGIKDLLAKNTRAAEVTVRISGARPATPPRALPEPPVRGTAPSAELPARPRTTGPLPRLGGMPRLPST